MVDQVEPGGPADQIGLRRGDILFQVEQYYVSGLEDLGMVLEEVRPGQAVRIGIARGNLRAWVGLQARGAAGAGGV